MNRNIAQLDTCDPYQSKLGTRYSLNWSTWFGQVNLKWELFLNTILLAY